MDHSEDEPGQGFVHQEPDRHQSQPKHDQGDRSDGYPGQRRSTLSVALRLLVEGTDDTGYGDDIDRRDLDERFKNRLEKRARLQGPIDDAFTSEFIVIKPTGAGFRCRLLIKDA